MQILSTNYQRRTNEKTLDDSIFEAGDIVQCPLILFYDGRLDRWSRPLDSINKIGDFLKKNKNLVVELGSHTDYRNSEAYNIALSRNRAKTIAEYLITEMGIDSSRIKYKGYGPRAPRIAQQDLALPSGKIVKKGAMLTKTWIDANVPRTVDKNDYEAVMQLNRRTELLILGTDHKSK
jgi:outer membrane protein OmpA-like peptidoglycan-associated protein